MSSVAADERTKPDRKRWRIAALLGVGAVIVLTTYLIFATRSNTSLRVRFDFTNWHFTVNERVHVMGNMRDAPKEITTTRSFGPMIVTTRRYEGWWNRPHREKQ